MSKKVLGTVRVLEEANSGCRNFVSQVVRVCVGKAPCELECSTLQPPWTRLAVLARFLRMCESKWCCRLCKGRRLQSLCFRTRIISSLVGPLGRWQHGGGKREREKAPQWYEIGVPQARLTLRAWPPVSHPPPTSPFSSRSYHIPGHYPTNQASRTWPLGGQATLKDATIPLRPSSFWTLRLINIY